ncbi:MAG: hypothetical protein JXJ17_10685 [Anaerolineae bacterium]|nr:hypothetical protein [Anaerolineae bacterium]
MRHTILAALILPLVLLITPVGEPSVLQNGDNDGLFDDPEVEAILDQMSPEERVGQLFLVTFYGSEVDAESEIALLIDQYNIGGVVLLGENDNFGDPDNLASQVYRLTGDLQRLADSRQPLSDSKAGESQDVQYIPLFVGVEYEGSSWPVTGQMSGLTPVASNMALGATWNPDYALATGQVVGDELEALGINLLLGPSADVVEEPQPLAPGDMGTRVFGGEPFWVSRMTAAYVSGVHSGSDGRVAIAPRSFPGYGGADRLASIEIPTVRRSRDQLIQVDLQPFYSVTGNAADPLSVAEGLLVGHIRYQGFQGENPRLTTKPISLDPAALSDLLALEPVASWRDAGGIVISDALGLRGVRRFYDPDEVNFPGRRIALDAFSAGNDLLYVGGYGTSPQVDQTAAVIDTLDFFVQRYESDPAFQVQVDNSIRRILRVKLNLYGSFTLGQVLPGQSGLEGLGMHDEVTIDVARSALTLVSPGPADLVAPPQQGETIVIFTDARSIQQCSTCPAQPIIPVDGLRSAILSAYGPQATGLVNHGQVYAFSFQELQDYIEYIPSEEPVESEPEAVVEPEETVKPENPEDAPSDEPVEGEPEIEPSPTPENTPEPDPVESALGIADWVVFVTLNADEDEEPSSAVLKQFLANRSVQSDTRIVVMAMGAPYYLDSTEVSKLTAFYALYGYSSPFIDVAARALFQEVAPTGASPVSINAVNYDILSATSPDPAQTIELMWTLEGVENGAGEAELAEDETPSPTVEPLIDQGDTLRLSTGVIIDENSNPVPDGTPVDFVLNYIEEGIRDTQSATTVGGVAQTAAVISRTGRVEISAVSGDAVNSQTLALVGGRITEVAPTIAPTPVPLTPVTDTPEPEPTTSVQTTPTITPTPEGPGTETEHSVEFGDLAVVLILLVGISGGVFVLGLYLRDFNFGLLIALPAFLTGLLAYNYYALALPGIMMWRSWVGSKWGAVTFSCLGAFLGVGITMLTIYLRDRYLARFLPDRNQR